MCLWSTAESEIQLSVPRGMSAAYSGSDCSESVDRLADPANGAEVCGRLERGTGPAPWIRNEVCLIKGKVCAAGGPTEYLRSEVLELANVDLESSERDRCGRC